MKLSYINEFRRAAAQQTNEPISNHIKFTVAGNSATAIVPLKLPGDAIASQKLVVESSTQRSKGGVLRAMVKVSLPYTALVHSGYDGANQVDQTRSGRSISAHIVFTLPKQVCEDLTGVGGTNAMKSADAQVKLLQSLLMQLCRDRIDYTDATGSFVRTAEGETTLLDFHNGVTHRCKINGNMKWQYLTDSTQALPGYEHIQSGTTPLAAFWEEVKVPMPTDQLAGYVGIQGFDLTQCSTGTPGLDSFIGRALNGYRPLDFESDVSVGVTTAEERRP